MKGERRICPDCMGTVDVTKDSRSALKSGDGVYGLISPSCG